MPSNQDGQTTCPTCNSIRPQTRAASPGWVCPDPWHFRGTGTNPSEPADSLEQEIVELLFPGDGLMEEDGSSVMAMVRSSQMHRIEKALALIRRTLRKELQSLASSSDWRIHLEDRLEQLKENGQ